MAGSNALYKQSGHHPAPLFGSFGANSAKAEPTPVMPAERPVKLLQDQCAVGDGQHRVALPHAPGRSDRQ